jgi:hypothetical protein
MRNIQSLHKCKIVTSYLLNLLQSILIKKIKIHIGQQSFLKHNLMNYQKYIIFWKNKHFFKGNKL